MTKSEKQWWEEERAKGYDSYLLRRGLLRAGLPVGILVTLYSIFTHHPIAPVWELLVKFGFYVVGVGALMGVLSWQSHERDYKKPTEDDDEA
jgi:hypothetical protein